jgi:hypothetical protein
MLEANDMVESFTTDLDSAKALFDKVGVDLGALDLEPVAEVVEKLKENKDDRAATRSEKSRRYS